MTTHLLLLTALLCPLSAAAPAGPAEPAAAGSTTAAPPVEDGTTQALVCSLIVDELPYKTFRRQRFDSWTTCRCVSPMRATCQPDTFYPTVEPGTPQAVLAQETAFSGSTEYLTLLNAFSIQQMCFFDHLRGRTCAFSWERGHRPACDCAQELEEEASADATEETDEEVKSEEDKQAMSTAGPVTTGEQASPQTTTAATTTQAATETTTASPEPAGASDGGGEGASREPRFPESAHLRRGV